MKKSARRARRLPFVRAINRTAEAGTSVGFRVLIDGRPPGAAHGIDVDENGEGTLTGQRLYQLIRQRKPIADRQVEIEFFGSDVELFAITFG